MPIPVRLVETEVPGIIKAEVGVIYNERELFS